MGFVAEEDEVESMMKTKKGQAKITIATNCQRRLSKLWTRLIRTQDKLPAPSLVAVSCGWGICETILNYVYVVRLQYCSFILLVSTFDSGFVQNDDLGRLFCSPEFRHETLHKS